MSARGAFTGNRGCLVDDQGEIVRHHRGTLWIICELQYRGWQHPLNAPRTWTPVFFLDDAVALAAGHRPCGLCRRSQYQSYQSALAGAPTAPEVNRRLAGERGRTWTAKLETLPVGTVILGWERTPLIVLADRVGAFTFDGWVNPDNRSPRGSVEVLTPPTSVAALAGGFVPLLHPTIGSL
ncbi:hypothetical protein BH18ACT5_BH18ACT5_18950 [soil metagenome]